MPRAPLAFAGRPRHGAAMNEHVAAPVPESGAAVDLSGAVRRDWTRGQVRALFDLPFPDLIFHAQRIHRLHFDPREVQISTLLSIKTGGCPEDCAYCPQSAHYETGVKAEKLMEARRGPRRGAGGQARRREPLLHGRRLAHAEGPRPRRGVRHGRGRQGARASRPARRSAC